MIDIATNYFSYYYYFHIIYIFMKICDICSFHYFQRHQLSQMSCTQVFFSSIDNDLELEQLKQFSCFEHFSLSLSLSCHTHTYTPILNTCYCVLGDYKRQHFRRTSTDLYCTFGVICCQFFSFVTLVEHLLENNNFRLKLSVAIW